MEKRLYPMRIGAVAAGLALALGGCAETQLGAQIIKSAARTTPAPAQPVATAADPTLAPEAFDATGLTIWDGAATLQGIWFAHPLAQRAQRVRVTNLENGLITEGALFKRDPALSGPSILVSSDAARTLGLTPGAATELQIVALREGPIPRQTQTAVAEPAATPAVETAALAAPVAATDAADTAADAVTPDDGKTLAVAPVAADGTDDAVDAVPPSPAPLPEGTAEIETAAAEPLPDVTPPADETVEAITAETPAPVDTAQPEPEQAAPAIVEPEAELAGETVEEPSPQTTSAPIATADAPVAADASTPTEELPELIAVDSSQIALAETQLLPPAPAARPPKPAPLTVPPLEEIGPADSQLARGEYLQVGSFSIEPNAAILVQNLLRRGQPAQYVNRSINGKPFSIVIIGPLGSAVKERTARDAAAAEGLKETIKVTL